MLVMCDASAYALLYEEKSKLKRKIIINVNTNFPMDLNVFPKKRAREEL